MKKELKIKKIDGNWETFSNYERVEEDPSENIVWFASPDYMDGKNDEESFSLKLSEENISWMEN